MMTNVRQRSRGRIRRHSRLACLTPVVCSVPLANLAMADPPPRANAAAAAGDAGVDGADEPAVFPETSYVERVTKLGYLRNLARTAGDGDFAPPRLQPLAGRPILPVLLFKYPSIKIRSSPTGWKLLARPGRRRNVSGNYLRSMTCRPRSLSPVERRKRWPEARVPKRPGAPGAMHGSRVELGGPYRRCKGFR